MNPLFFIQCIHGGVKKIEYSRESRIDDRFKVEGFMAQTVADLDITYDVENERKDWRHRLGLRQAAVVQQADMELQAHVRALGLDSVSVYQHWCMAQGFSPLLGKSRGQLQRELAVAQVMEKEVKVDPAHRADAAIQRLFLGQANASDAPFLKQIHAGFVRAKDRDEREALYRLLRHLDVHVDLSYDGLMIPKLGDVPSNRYIFGVTMLARHHHDWVRPIEGWTPSTQIPRDQFAFLARHLLAPVGVQRCMDVAWFRDNEKLAARQQDWFKVMGQGHSICSADQPPRLTRKMAVAFLNAPENFTLEEAMRYGQVMGQDGDERLAEAVAGSLLGTSFRNADFWDEVIAYLVREPDLSRACVGAVIDYLEAQRFERREVVQSDGSVKREKPPQPKFQITGRSVRNVLRWVEAWQLSLPVDDQRTSVMTRWCLREDILRRVFKKGNWMPRAFADPVRHLFVLGMEDDDAYRAWCVAHGLRPTLYKTWQEHKEECDLADRGTTLNESEVAFQAHLEVLGLEDKKAYREWCRSQGFGDGIDKTRRQQRREIRLMEKVRGDQALAKARQEMRRSQVILTQIYEGEVERDDLIGDVLKRIYDGFEALDNAGCDALYQLLMRVDEVADDLLVLERAIPHLGDVENNRFVAGVIALAKHHCDWVRDSADWRPGRYSSTRRRFGALARHLFADFDVPVFMDAVWFMGMEEDAYRAQHWFLHVGKGGNIRTADIPLHLTKMMAHRFLEAPDHFSLTQAFRYGQVLGQGGSEGLMRAILETRLGQSFEHEDFWHTVVLFLVNSPMLDPAYVRPVVDYIHFQKYEPEEVTYPDGRVEVFPPPEPRFSMRGRSRAKLFRAVDRWMGYEKQEEQAPQAEWKKSGFEGVVVKEKDAPTGLALTWQVVELRTAKELTTEGREMSHCVGSYANRCRRGNMSVWSIQLIVEDDKPLRVMTVAVDNKKKVVTQSRGKHNAAHWVEEQGRRNDRNFSRHLERNDRAVLMRSNRILGMWLRQEDIRAV